jgi:hypothetical protein
MSKATAGRARMSRRRKPEAMPMSDYPSNAPGRVSRMSVIANTTLLMRRTSEAHRRREALRAKREQASRALPEWAVMPLKLAGMSAVEIGAVLKGQVDVESEAGIEELDAEIEKVDGELDRIEMQLLSSPAAGLDGVRALLQLALGRMRETTVTDESSVFYDYGGARLLSLIERAADELDDALAEGQRKAG